MAMITEIGEDFARGCGRCARLGTARPTEGLLERQGPNNAGAAAERRDRSGVRIVIAQAESRIGRLRDRILAGKGATDR